MTHPAPRAPDPRELGPAPAHDGLLPPTLGPRRTFALIAGVETYEVSHRWNLRGPARDALRFARRLTDDPVRPVRPGRAPRHPLELRQRRLRGRRHRPGAPPVPCRACRKAGRSAGPTASCGSCRPLPGTR
ncbi:hypothetical protein ACFYN3_19055 [Streptomyces lavendulae]|uniref:hypothetical protein n=1 Tax=Streptomyces lavendulae TaxID=1914 RepID=UPI0036A6631D